jgi:hypothetical protein
MNAALVIDAIVRQTTVLIAALATSAGQRAPLSHVADQVFADLVRELKEQGVGQKVIADMFGMALRTYQARVSRLSESVTERGRSLWEAVLAHVQERGTAARVDVLRRFGDDDEGVVRGVLRDLVESGLVYQTGRGEGIAYRAAPVDEPLARQHESRTLDNLVLIAVHRRGPLNRAALREIVPVDDDITLEESLARLVQEGAVRRASREGEAEYDCDQCVIPFGDPMGWEAAIFDQYQAMVTAFVTKLRLGKRRADLSDKIGGSTFVFDLWAEHPLAEECLGFLKKIREEGMALRKRLEAHNTLHAQPVGAAPFQVISYVGQTVREDEEASED